MNLICMGIGIDVVISGLEGVWIIKFIEWDGGYMSMLFDYEWELIKSLVGVWQWVLKDIVEEDMFVDVVVGNICIMLIMMDVDMVMKMDFVYCKIIECFCEDQEYFNDIFVCVWFKFMYCDMGLKICYIGFDVL